MIPLINGVAYDFTQIIMTILDVPITGVKAISYDENQEKTNEYGTGNRPHARGRSAIEAEGSLDLSMSETEKIRDAAIVADPLGYGSLLSIPPFDIVIVFANVDAGIKTHVLKNVEFTNDGLDGTQGDTDLTKSHSIIFSHIQYR